MATSVIEKATRRSSLSSEQIGRLARTYDDASQPIWVRDLNARCLYRNSAAEHADPGASPSIVFEIVDHHGQVVAHLLTHID